MKKKIFLSGACRNVSVSERDDWREYFEEKLGELYCVFNPNKKFSYDKNNVDDERLVMNYFLHELDDSDFVIVNLNNSAQSVGTGMEIMHAVDKGKFIIGFGNENVYGYIWECCDAICKDKEEVWNFVVSYM